jgi:hypothetical protein
VIPGSTSGLELDDRGWISLARSSGRARRRPDVAGPGTVMSARPLAAPGRRASYRRPPDKTGPLQTVPPGQLGRHAQCGRGPCGDCRTSTIYQLVRIEPPRRADRDSWPGARGTRERMSVPRAGRYRTDRRQQVADERKFDALHGFCLCHGPWEGVRREASVFIHLASVLRAAALSLIAARLGWGGGDGAGAAGGALAARWGCCNIRSGCCGRGSR